MIGSPSKKPDDAEAGARAILDALRRLVRGLHLHSRRCEEALGLTGGYGGVIGMESAGALRKMLLSLPVRHSPADTEVEFWGLFVETDAQGRARSTQQVKRVLA